MPDSRAIAYFSMEIALKSNMSTYSGGGLAPDSPEYTRDRQEIHDLAAK